METAVVKPDNRGPTPISAASNRIVSAGNTFSRSDRVGMSHRSKAPPKEVLMDFIDQISGDSPVPAGGAAAAYSACIAVGLLHKIVSAEIRRTPGRPAMETTLLTLKKETGRLLDDLRRLVAEDSDSYVRHSRALRGNDRAEKKQTFSGVVDVSMKVIEKSASGMEWARQLGLLAPERLKPHLLVACELLAGAIYASVHVVSANIRTIASQAKRASYLGRLRALQDECRLRRESIMEALESEAGAAQDGC